MNAPANDSRFSRHSLVPGWNHSRLQEATVIIAGMGALGNECSRLLAMAGVGHMTICDHDTVEITNLSRTPLFRAADIGRFKVEAAEHALGDLAPGIEIDARDSEFRRAIGCGELRDASLVLGCVDSRAARLELAGRCGLVGAPFIDGGTHPWGGEVRLYLDPDGPCYGCGLTPQQRSESTAPEACGEHAPTGAHAPIAALVAAWMSTLALRHLLELPCPRGTLVLDATSGQTRQVAHHRDAHCPLHERLPEARLIDITAADTVQELLAAIPAGASVETWSSFQQGTQCRKCDHVEVNWGRPQQKECELCGGYSRPICTRTLNEAPGEMRLADLGVPTREILLARHHGKLNYVELSSASRS